MNLSKIHHIAIIVSDYEAAKVIADTRWAFVQFELMPMYSQFSRTV